MIVSVVSFADLPDPGLPPEAINTTVPALDPPALIDKVNGYNSIEFAFNGTAGGPGDYALFMYWHDSKTWKPEGPRGSTPTTVDLTGANSVPVRISVPITQRYLAVVFMDTGTQITTPSTAEVQLENR